MTDGQREQDIASREFQKTLRKWGLFISQSKEMQLQK